MSLALKTLAWLAPRAALRRANALAALGAMQRYAGAQGGRRAGTFSGRGTSANTEIGSQLATLRDRSRELVRDHWAFQRILDVTVGHAIGSGISVLPDNDSDRVDKNVGLLFEEWCESADVSGEMNFHALTALAVRSMLEGGDCVIRFLDTGAADYRTVPLALQLMEGDYIDVSKDATAGESKPGTRSRLGVGLGPQGQRTGYWLFSEHPGESGLRSSLTSTFVEREFVIHCMKPLRPGQVRGVPVVAPIIMSARDMADLMDATIVKAKIEACFGAFITKTGDTSPLDSLNKTEDNERLTELSPGLMAELREGEDIKFATPSTNTSFEPIYNSTLYAMAAGAGITYDQISGDLRQANYSSLRAGKIEFRRLIEQMQWLNIIPRIHKRITDRFIDRAILTGKLRAKSGGYRWKFIPPANEPIDPIKDLTADVLAVRAGRMSPQEFIAGWGVDYKKVIADHKAFFELADSSKVVFDIDPRKVSQTGKAQVLPSADPAVVD